LRVLLAEDNPVNQRLVVKLMEKQGHSLVVTGNGREALTALEREEFDLVLMDVQMPEMGGFEAAGCIREREKSTGRHIPIIAMTAHALKGDRERCLEAGMDTYVSKPVQSRLLFEAIESVRPSPLPAAIAADEPTTEKATFDGEPFDREAALAMIDGDMELFRELAGLFLTESVNLLEQVRVSIAERNAKGLERAAHSLKGSVAAFCAESARVAAQTLESMGARGDLDHVDEVADELRCEVERLASALAEYRKESVLCES
jgi:CheY-like chemotaxis protein